MIENSEFSIICDILSFNIIYNPDELNDFETMFIWDFLIDIFQNATYLNKNKIIQVLSQLSKEEYYIDIEYIILGLNFFNILELFLDENNDLYSIYYTFDLLLYFSLNLNEISFRNKKSVINVIDESGLINKLESLVDECNEWLEEYIMIIVNELKKYIDA